MTLSPDFRARTATLLDTAPPDATVVVASTGPDGHLLMQTATAETAIAHQPAAFARIARALLSQASDELDTDNAGAAEIQLLGEVMSALSELPDNEEFA